MRIGVAVLFCVAVVAAVVVIGSSNEGLGSAFFLPVLGGLSFLAGLAVGRPWVLLVPLVPVAVLFLPTLLSASAGDAEISGQEVARLIGLALAAVEGGMVVGVLAARFLVKV